MFRRWIVEDATMMQLSRMEQVPVRRVWPHEENHFTPWLAEHFDYLNDALDLNMTVVGLEQNIPGSGRADIVARCGDAVVIVENQLESSDDDHFVRMLHYAARSEAQVVIWIAHGFYPKHREILKWLDESSSIDIYCVEVSAWSIDGAVAPMFRRVVPNDWVDPHVLADRVEAQAYRGYYSPLVERLEQAGLTRVVDPTWGPMPSFRWFGTEYADIHYGLEYGDDGKAWAFLLIEGLDDNQHVYDGLVALKSEIESETGFALEWGEDDGSRWVGMATPASPADSPERQREAQDWMYTSLTNLREILSPRLDEIALAMEPLE